MFKTFLTGIVLGAAAVVGAGLAVPLASHERIASITRVAPNGGRLETFHINLPDDRLLLTSDAATPLASVPEGLYLPDAPALAGTRVELYRLRDTSAQVIGVASRIVGTDGAGHDWMLYMPARGALFLSVDDTVDGTEGTTLSGGPILGGSEEMRDELGRFEIRRAISVSETDGDSRARIEIATTIESVGG